MELRITSLTVDAQSESFDWSSIRFRQWHGPRYPMAPMNTAAKAGWNIPGWPWAENSTTAGWTHSIPTTGPRTWRNGALQLREANYLKVCPGYVAVTGNIAGFSPRECRFEMNQER